MSNILAHYANRQPMLSPREHTQLANSPSSRHWYPKKGVSQGKGEVSRIRVIPSNWQLHPSAELTSQLATVAYCPRHAKLLPRRHCLGTPWSLQGDNKCYRAGLAQMMCTSRLVNPHHDGSIKPLIRPPQSRTTEWYTEMALETRDFRILYHTVPRCFSASGVQVARSVGARARPGLRYSVCAVSRVRAHPEAGFGVMS